MRGKVLSTVPRKNRAGVLVMTCVIETRKNQNVTAEWIDSLNERARPVTGDWVVVAKRDQSFGGYLAFGFVDIINQVFDDPGVKFLFGRDTDGNIKTQIVLDDLIIIEKSGGAGIELIGKNIILNKGEGSAVEAERLQNALNDFSQKILDEFKLVQAGTEPNPAAPYIPSQDLPVDISPAKSETVKLL